MFYAFGIRVVSVRICPSNTICLSNIQACFGDRCLTSYAISHAVLGILEQPSASAFGFIGHVSWHIIPKRQ